MSLIALASFNFIAPPVPSKDLGKPGKFEWVETGKLRIDERYQRPVDAAGRKTIFSIIENFRWTKFAPLVVAPRKGGLFAIVDGQHRAIGCVLHGGIKSVPCYILSCTEEEEAGAFATINGIVTRMHPQYLFRARIASGDSKAVAADEAAKAAGVKIMAYPMAASQLKVGETLSGRTIELELQRVGRQVLVAALELITRTGSGNAGLVKAALIEGFCDVYATHPKWLEAEEDCRRIVHRKTVKQILQDALLRQAEKGGTIRGSVGVVLAEELQASLGDGGKTTNPVEVAKAAALKESRKGNLLGAVARHSKPATAKKSSNTPPRGERPAPQPPIVLSGGAPLRHQPKINGGSAGVSESERALIAQHAATKGVRKFSTADTADDFQLVQYLERKGFTVVRYALKQSGKGFKINDKGYTREQFIAFINKQRAKDSLPPIGALK